MVVTNEITLHSFYKPAIRFLIVGLFVFYGQFLKGQPTHRLVYHQGKAASIEIVSDYRKCLPQPFECWEIIVQGSSVGVLGDWTSNDTHVSFTPFLPFSPGISYGLYYNAERLDTFQISVAAFTRNVSLSVFPSPDTLPENLLKMYFQFSEPMQEVSSGQFVAVFNENGEPLSDFFLSLQPELWNLAGDCLTLWIDPGRVKRELLRNQKMGAPLIQGRKYKLVVSPGWKSKNGGQLVAAVEKEFIVTDRDENSPNPQNWIIKTPMAGTRVPLVVSFKESLDFGLLTDSFDLIDPNGKPLAVSIEPGSSEKSIHLTPAKPWTTGEYILTVSAKLEDLAGNNLYRLFDQEVEVEATAFQEVQDYQLSFRID